MNFCLNNFKNQNIHGICVLLFCYNLKVCRNLPGMHAHNDIPSRARHFQRFLYTCISQAHISFSFAVLMVDLPWCVSSCESWHIFVLNDSVIQGSLNNHCSNTPEKKIEFVTSFVMCGKPLKGKTKGILLGKLLFPPSTYSMLCYFAEIGGIYV